MGCPKENIRTQVICLFFLGGVIEWCLYRLWWIILCALQNIQSTNWQTMRFKPPPPNSDIGWRVEFRPMEVRKASACTKTHFLLSRKVPGILPSSIEPLLVLWFFSRVARGEGSGQQCVIRCGLWECNWQENPLQHSKTCWWIWGLGKGIRLVLKHQETKLHLASRDCLFPGEVLEKFRCHCFVFHKGFYFIAVCFWALWI